MPGGQLHRTRECLRERSGRLAVLLVADLDVAQRREAIDEPGRMATWSVMSSCRRSRKRPPVWTLGQSNCGPSANDTREAVRQSLCHLIVSAARSS